MIIHSGTRTNQQGIVTVLSYIDDDGDTVEQRLITTPVVINKLNDLDNCGIFSSHKMDVLDAKAQWEAELNG
jgi:hypothetical protein